MLASDVWSMSLAPRFWKWIWSMCKLMFWVLARVFGVLRDEFDGDLKKQPMQNCRPGMEQNIYLVLCFRCCRKCGNYWYWREQNEKWPRHQPLRLFLYATWTLAFCFLSRISLGSINSREIRTKKKRLKQKQKWRRLSSPKRKKHIKAAIAPCHCYGPYDAI